MVLLRAGRAAVVVGVAACNLEFLAISFLVLLLLLLFLLICVVVNVLDLPLDAAAEVPVVVDGAAAPLAPGLGERPVHGHDQLGGEAGALRLEAVNVLRVQARELARPFVQQLEEPVRDRGPPLPVARPQDQRPPDLQVGERVLFEQVPRDDRGGLLAHPAPLALGGGEQVRPEGVVHAPRRAKVGDGRGDRAGRSWR
jgi:hypothetical protein